MLEELTMQYPSIAVQRSDTRVLELRGWDIESITIQAMRSRITGKLYNASIVRYTRDDSNNSYCPIRLSWYARRAWINDNIPLGLDKRSAKQWVKRYASSW